MDDLRLAVRQLRASPVISAVAILSLALGIGANTAIFSLVNSLVLRPLPVVEPERLVLLSSARAGADGGTVSFTYGVWEQIRQRAAPFDGAGAWWPERLNLAQAGGQLEPADVTWVSGDYFRTLGVPAVLGRTIVADDDMKGGGSAGPVAVISYEMWQRRFAGASSVIGARLNVERIPFTIVGVAPPGFFGVEVGRSFDVALPMNTEPLIRGEESRIDPRRGFYALTVLLRLRPGQSVDAATAILRGIQPQIRAASMLPPPAQKQFLSDPFVASPAATGMSRLREQYQRPLLVILAVVALVLLIACANIANLQLARGIARRHDSSVRVALGASRWRLMRPALLESGLLAALGTGVALLVAQWSSRMLVARLSTATNRVYLDLSLDWRVLAFTAGIAIATVMLFGTIPALRGSAVGPADALREQGRGAAPGSAPRISNALIVAQVALSIVVVVAAGLFVRSFQNLATLPRGFDTDPVLLVNVNVARATVAPADRIGLVERLVEALAAVPGATMASGSMVTPIQGFGIVDIVRAEGAGPSLAPFVNGELAPQATYANYVTPGWFATYGTPIVRGRDFDARDSKGAPAAIIVNEAFVRKFLSGREPIGATLQFETGGDPRATTVVGVVADSTFTALRDGNVPVEYAPLSQFDFGSPPADFTLSLRSQAGSPMLLAGQVASTMSSVDRDVVFRLRTLTDQIDGSLIQERLVAVLSGTFGALALLLAGLGLYGVTAHAVARRRAEIGIRMALGSGRAAVLRLVLSRAVMLVAAGAVIGLGVSVWVATSVSTLLYGLEPRDPATLTTAVIVLMAVGTAAAWMPAYRASRIDPASVLRET